MVGCGQTSPLIDTATSGHRLRKEGVTNRPPAALTPREETTPLDPAIRSTHFGLPPRGGPPVRAVRSAPRPLPPGPAVDPDPGLPSLPARSCGPRPSHPAGHPASAPRSRRPVDHQPAGRSPTAPAALPLDPGLAASGSAAELAGGQARLTNALSGLRLETDGHMRAIAKRLVCRSAPVGQRLTTPATRSGSAASGSIHGRRWGSKTPGRPRTHSAAWMQRRASKLTVIPAPL